jgi:(R,R)-butanediol dehydrogenase/meso-butanediol dehydrogenase/diacetyl reductase
MIAAILKGPGIISIEDMETPKAGNGEVVVKVSYCGICGSDLRRCLNAAPNTAEIGGHEFSGVIAEIGPGVKGWSVGQRVTPIPFAPCWQCYACTHGTPHLCRNAEYVGANPKQPGGFAEYVRVKASQLYTTPDEINDQEAALAEPLAVSLRAVLLSGITIGSSVCIIGAGTIGLFTVQCAKLSGAGSIYVAQRSEPRATLARQMGADMVINPTKEDFVHAVWRKTTVGADASIECAGNPEAFHLAVKSVRSSGRVILVGIGGPAEFPTKELVMREIEIKGSMMYWNEFPQSLELLKLHKINTKGIVTKIVPLKDIQAAFTDLLHSRDQIKVLMSH